METREFHIGDVLGVTTGYSLPPNGVVGVGKVIEFMEGSPCFDFALAEAAERCTPVLVVAYPFLGFRSLESVGRMSETAARAWVDEQARKHGETLAVPRAPWHSGGGR